MQPVAVIIDSIQTVYLDDVNGSAGSVSQVCGLSACCYWWHNPGVAHSMQPSGSACRWHAALLEVSLCSHTGARVRHSAAPCRQAGEDPHLPDWPRNQGALLLALLTCNHTTGSGACSTAGSGACGRLGIWLLCGTCSRGRLRGRGCWSMWWMWCCTWRASASSPTACCAASRTAMARQMRWAPKLTAFRCLAFDPV